MNKIQLETLLKENPAAMAAVQQMATVKLQGKGKRKVKATTALTNNDHPSHQKAVSIFQKLKDKFSKKKEAEPKKQSTSDANFYKKQYTGESVNERKLSSHQKKAIIIAIEMSGNMTNAVKKIEKIKKGLSKDKKVADALRLSNESKGTNQYTIGRNKMKITEDILRKVIRSEIKKTLITESSPGFAKREFGDPLPTLSGVMKQHQNRVVKEEDDESFSQPIPAQIDRYMKKFIDAVAKGNLNRKRKLAILGRTIIALKLDPQEVSKYARLVKREL